MSASESRAALRQREEQLTAEVLQSFDATSSTRVRELLQGLVCHLHAYAREVRLTEAEWRFAVDDAVFGVKESLIEPFRGRGPCGPSA
ncbi:MAG: dioxygenase [Solirubrobacteraceae bacterium]